LPAIYIDASSAPDEGMDMEVTVWLYGSTEEVVTVDFDFVELSAGAMATIEDDYYIDSHQSGGTVTFEPWETEVRFWVRVVNDTALEGREWISIQLSNPVNAQLADECPPHGGEYGYDDYTADFWIDDPEDPYVIVAPFTEVLEPLDDEDTVYAVVRVELGSGWGGDTTEVAWQTSVEAGDTATEGDDFVPMSDTVSFFPGGDPHVDVYVPLVYDGTGESDETFHIILTSATNGITIILAQGLVTIFDAIDVTEEGPPPDCQCGGEVGRTLTGLSSNKGGEFWEGDAVTFSTTLSAGDPPGNESFVWEWRPLRLITRSGQKVYGNPLWQWDPLPSAGTGSSASYTFAEPFIGQVRVTLTSAHTVTHKIIEVRAKAAFPVNFRVTASDLVGANIMQVNYAWDSSSGPGRLADLDGVELGEFLWYTPKGKANGEAGKTPLPYEYPDPPFSNSHEDGYFATIGGAGFDITDGEVGDQHGDIYLTREATKSINSDQYYWYQITDGFNYWKETDLDVNSSKMLGDPYTKQRFRDMQITFALRQISGNWQLLIEKRSGAQVDGSETIVIPSFPWPPQ
jgi:hypothetical protein